MSVVTATGLDEEPQPKKELPHHCKSWRHMIIDHRICELRDVEYRKCAAIWENGVMVRDLPFEGVLVERLINDAISHFEFDELDAAERCCEAADAAMVKGLPKIDNGCEP